MLFENIYNTFQPAIYRYCLSRLKNPEYAKDCTQNVFLKFYKKSKILTIDTNVEAWLIIAAKYEIMHFMRDNAEYFSDLPLDEARHMTCEIISDNGVLDGIITAEEKKLLVDFYETGKTSEEIAEEKNISSAAVRQRIHRIKEKIKNELGDDKQLSP